MNARLRKEGRPHIFAMYRFDTSLWYTGIMAMRNGTWPAQAGQEVRMTEPGGRGAAWTEERSLREPDGRGAAWTEERGTSDQGRRRLQAPRQASGQQSTSDQGRRRSGGGMGRRAGPRRRAGNTA